MKSSFGSGASGKLNRRNRHYFVGAWGQRSQWYSSDQPPPGFSKSLACGGRRLWRLVGIIEELSFTTVRLPNVRGTETCRNKETTSPPMTFQTLKEIAGGLPCHGLFHRLNAGIS